MKKFNLVKRIVCLALALVACLGMFTGNATAASAASLKEGSYVPGFPLGYKASGYNVTVLNKYTDGSYHPSYLYNTKYGPLKKQARDGNSLLDIDTAVGAKVYAVQDGKVITNKTGSYKDYYVVVKHSDGTYAYYGHLTNTSNCKVGKTIKAGTLVGKVSHNSHLHFEWSGHDPYCEFAAKGLVHTYGKKCGASVYPHTHSAPSNASTASKSCKTHSYSGGICKKCGFEWKYTVNSMKATSYKITKASGAPVWNRPYSNNAKQVTKMQKNSIVTVVGKTVNKDGNTWYLLSTGSWIYSKNVTKVSTSSATRYVTGTDGTLNMRSSAKATNSKNIIGSIPEGAAVIVKTSKTSGSWIWVTYNGISGYVSRNYLSTKVPPINK